MTNGSGPFDLVFGLATVGALITGGFGIILAINSMTSGNEIGAGILLIASALAFGFIILVAARN